MDEYSPQLARIRIPSLPNSTRLETLESWLSAEINTVINVKKKHEASKLVKFWRDQAERDFACEAEEYEREEKENQQKRGDFLRRRWRRRNRTERNERVYVSFWIFLWIRTCWVCIKRKWRKRRSLGSNSNTECNHARITWTQANGLVVMSAEWNLLRQRKPTKIR